MIIAWMLTMWSQNSFLSLKEYDYQKYLDLFREEENQEVIL